MGEHSIEHEVRHERELSRLQTRAGDFFAMVFDEAIGPEARLERLHENLDHFIAHLGDVVDAQALRTGIDATGQIADRAQFIEHGLQVVQPLLEQQIAHPDIARKIFLERHDFTPLNDVLAFGLTEDGEVAHIHLAPATDITNLRTVVIEGLQELARRIQADPETFGNLNRVAGTSWIIAEHPKIMERLGFTIDGPAGDETVQRAREGGETRPLMRAHIDRADFLRLYGNAG